MEQVSTVAAEWQPHLLILDMALNGLRVMQIRDTLWGRTTEPRAMLWTSTSAICVRCYGLMVGSRDSSPRWPDAAIGFCLRAKPADAIQGMEPVHLTLH